MLRLRALLTSLAVVSTALVALPVSAPPAAAVIITGGQLFPVSQKVLFDTRIGRGLPRRPLRPHSTTAVRVNGHAGVPALQRDQPQPVSMVVLNLTVMSATARDGFLSVYDASGPRPNVSSIHIRHGATVSNLVTVPVSRLGEIKVYNSAGRTAVRAEVVGFYGADDRALLPLLGYGWDTMPLRSPAGMAETRGSSLGPLRPHELLRPALDLDDTLLNKQVRGVMVMITASRGTRGGHLTVWAGSGKEPKSGTLSYAKAAAVTTMAIVPTSGCRTCGPTLLPAFNVRNHSRGTVEIRVEAVAYYLSSSLGSGYRLQRTTPTRISDSRRDRNGARLQPGKYQLLTAPARVATEYGETVGLIANVTVVEPTRTTALRLGMSPEHEDTNNLSVTSTRGRTASTSTLVTVSNFGKHFFVSDTAGQADFTVDVVAHLEPPFGSRLTGSIPFTR